MGQRGKGPLSDRICGLWLTAAFAFLRHMTRRAPDISRRLLLSGLIATGASAALAAPPKVSLRPVVRPRDLASLPPRKTDGAALLKAAGLSGKAGFMVADAATGAVLDAYNPVLSLPPASTAKAITALYGLEHLGSSYRFPTRLIAGGPVEGGRIKGDLILAGAGDPTLDTDTLGELAANLKAAGIFEVTGKLRIYDSGWPNVRTIDPGQPDHLGYSPAVGGVNLNFNRVHFEWKRANAGQYQVTMQARGEKFRPAVDMASMQIADRAAPIYTYAQRGGVEQWSVAQDALGKGGARWLPVRKPQAYAAETFAAIARSYGIALKIGAPAGRLPKGAQTLVSYGSAPLGDILRGMLKYSTNLTAECVGIAATQRRGGKPGSLKASGRGMADWLQDRAGAHKARFVDHSGLGDASRISAGEMVRSLVQLSPGAALQPLLKEIPMRDKNGKVQENYPAQIRAKTGTLNFVSTLAGFVEVPGNRNLAFAIFCADMDKRRALSRSERERPEGNRTWVRKARNLHLALIDQWTRQHQG